MINKLKQSFSTKDGKVLLENFISLSTLQLVAIVLPLLTLPYVLRVIGFEKYGIIVISTSLVAYFQSLTDFSFKVTATRDVAVFRGNSKKLNIIYSHVLTLKFFFLLISYLILSIVIITVPKFSEYSIIYFLSSLSLIGYAIFPEWFFQGMEKMKYITFLNLGVKLFFTVSIFLFVKEEKDFWVYPLLNSLGFIAAGIIGQIIMINKYKLRYIFISPKSLRHTVRRNFPIFINQFVPNLYNNSSTFLLGVITNNSLVGIYNAISIAVNLIITLIDIVSRVFFPFLNRNKNKFPLYAKLVMLLSSFLILVVLIFHPIVFWYLNLNYDKSFSTLLILSLSILGYSLYNIFGINYFIIHRKDKLVMWNTIFASLIGLVCVYPLIYNFGITGAAINLLMCRWIMGGGLMCKYLIINR